MVLIGCDVSLNSPGIVVWDDPWFDCYFFPHTKRLHGFQETVGQFRFKAVEYPTWNSREERYDALATAMVEKIDPYRRKAHTIRDVRVLIEGYAFMAKGRSVSALFENGAVFRNQLFRKGFKNVEEISPTSVKKEFTGSGLANKMHMLMTFEKKTGIDLYDVFGMKKPETDDVRSPIQDIVDAYALVEMNLPKRKTTSMAKIILGKLNEIYHHTRKDSGRRNSSKRPSRRPSRKNR